MKSTPEQRRAARLVVNAPVVVESIGQVAMSLHPSLAVVFRRVEADTSTVGQRFPAVIRDLSTNGAFVAGPCLPLLARVALRFELRGVGNVDAVGWVLWQRTAACDVPHDGGVLTLPMGFGVLFESIPLDTRSAIAALVGRS